MYACAISSAHLRSDRGYVALTLYFMQVSSRQHAPLSKHTPRCARISAHDYDQATNILHNDMNGDLMTMEGLNLPRD